MRTKMIKEPAKQGGAIVFILILCLLVSSQLYIDFCNNSYGEDQFNNPEIAMLSNAIGNIRERNDLNSINNICERIDKQNESVKSSLYQTLNSRLEELRAAEFIPIDKEDTAVNQAVIVSDMHSRIDNLELGSNATADDLRNRDEAVGLIAVVKDPLVRDELLKYLENKEKSEVKP